MHLSTGLLLELMDAGLIARQPTAMPVRIVFGAITEAALGIADASDPKASREQANWLLANVVRGL